MVKHILVGVDGSKESIDAAHFGQGLAAQTSAKVTLVFVIEPPQVIPVGPLSGYVMTSPPRSQEDLTKAKTLLDALAAEHPDVPTTGRVDMGKPAETLCNLAEQLEADLLVVGSKGHGAGQRFLLGSVSDRVVHHASCAVLVLRPKKKS